MAQLQYRDNPRLSLGARPALQLPRYTAMPHTSVAGKRFMGIFRFIRTFRVNGNLGRSQGHGLQDIFCLLSFTFSPSNVFITAVQYFCKTFQNFKYLNLCYVCWSDQKLTSKVEKCRLVDEILLSFNSNSTITTSSEEVKNNWT